MILHVYYIFALRLEQKNKIVALQQFSLDK